MGVKDFFVDISMIPWFGDFLSFLVSCGILHIYICIYDFGE